MKLKLLTSWIFRGWIVCLVLLLEVKMGDSKPTCKNDQYLMNSRCCSKCGPGNRLFAECTETKDTVCVKCNADEYQSGWTTKKSCTPQKYCDPGKGFLPRRQNLEAEEPCPCRPNFTCSPINCEYCERIHTCSFGLGLVEEKKTCVPCKKGFFSNEDSTDQCKPWTNCKALGRTENQAGTAQADAECGPPVSSAAPSWVIVTVLSVITVLSLLILLLFCYKDKMKLLSVNLRSCVQNLKRTRIQQDTLAPLYPSGMTGGLSKGAPCETTKLVCQVPLTPTDEPLYPSTPPAKDPLPRTLEVMEKEASREKTNSVDLSEGSGEPEEVSEDEGEMVSAPTTSCGCVSSVQEPLEVGENEDCSQAVDPGSFGMCCCGGSDGEERKKETDRGIKTDFMTGLVSVVSLSSSNPPPELCLPLSRADTKTDLKTNNLKLEEPYKLKCLDSTSIDNNNSVTSAVSSVGPLVTSSFVGDIYQDKAEPSSPGPSCEEKGPNKLSSGDCEIECPPESLQSQLVEPTNTSGQVSGNHNTTFISSGQVMNFSGDVIVVYVSQTSLGNEEAGPDDAFGSPVQEQADETATFFQSSSMQDSITQSTLQEQTLPVQEVMDERAPEKRKGTK
ncbi:tumor necrosis factor receptor superfamily member 11A isoform X2 [Periophthalmus magnuspinnatus]|uniref:tumor necrosis factor receptor superfamily member 11A isoform X2 n=1 Tax=Periophthalmus magnuspinnatus TaxID=409849 RepID=UPI002436453C|nr:tumor necrosis factor receptor superfamily member 11A isoform X2 [Periophthalmus magnuspinnatus]